MKKLLLLVATCIVALVAIAWLAGSPQKTLDGIVAAVDASEAQTLQQWVDLGSVQQSLGEQYRQFLGFKMRNSPDWPGAEASGLPGRIAQALAAEAITSASLPQLLQGNHRLLLGNRDVDYVPDDILHTALASRTERQVQAHSPFRYAVLFTDKQSHRPLMVLTLTFTGLSWQLTGVQLPMWGKLYDA